MTKADKREENIEHFYREGFLNRVGKTLFTNHFVINAKAGTIARLETVIDDDPDNDFLEISTKTVDVYKNPAEYLKDKKVLSVDYLLSEVRVLDQLLNV